MILQQGLLNTTALSNPGVYVNIVQPQTVVINGVPTNNLGLVGTASWGPVNVPTDFGTPAQGAALFGGLNARRYDLMTAAYIATLQGANNITGVRVTDGTDTPATAAVASSITFTARYTGSFGNGIQVSVGPGSAVGSYAVIVAAPGLPSEKFDNITGSGNTLWVAMAQAINNGNGALRGPSAIILATAGAGTGTPATASYSLTGGTDGAATITAATLVGQDTLPRKGLYSLRGQGCSVINLVDACDSTQWTYMNAFATAEGVYIHDSTPSGDTVANAAAALATAGIDSAWLKIMLGDWCQFYDQTNQVSRYVSPGAFTAGLRAVLGPQYSLLNWQINGIIATQKSATGQNYSYADIAALEAGRVDAIANPCPGGTFFGCQTGHNTSSNAAVHGDNYTSMTNYIATTINTGAGRLVGGTNLQSTLATDPYRLGVKATFDSLFLAMQNAGQIADWQTTCDLTNNTASQIGLGYCTVTILVQYLAVVEKLIVNMQGGQTVSIQRVSTTPAAIAA